MPESNDHGLLAVPELLDPFREEDSFADSEGKQAEDRKINPGHDDEKDSIFEGPMRI